MTKSIKGKLFATTSRKLFATTGTWDHVSTCTAHSGAKKAHDWAVEQLADLFRTTHRVKTQQVARSRGQRCGDIELAAYRANVAGPVPLVLDLRIAHDRFGSSSDPSLDGHLHYPNDLDGPLNEAAADKIRQYRADYNNRPSNAISCMPAIASTSGRLHSEFVRLLFLQAHRETGFLQLQEFSLRTKQWSSQLKSKAGNYRRAVCSSQLKSKAGNILAKAAALRLTLNHSIDGAPTASKSHTYPSRSLSFSFKSLSHRHSYLSLLFSSRFIAS